MILFPTSATGYSQSTEPALKHRRFKGASTPLQRLCAQALHRPSTGLAPALGSTYAERTTLDGAHDSYFNGRLDQNGDGIPDFLQNLPKPPPPTP
jgi:hypothetical protein